MENSRDIDGASHGRQALIANAFRTTVDGCAVAMRPGGLETWPMATAGFGRTFPRTRHELPSAADAI